MTYCNGIHCKCMNLNGSCKNHHFADCKYNPEAVAVTKPPMRSTEITKENLRVGDVVRHGDTRFRIVTLLGDIVAVMRLHKTGEDASDYLEWFKESMFVAKGYILEIEQPPQKLTHKQIEEKLGYRIEIIEG